LQARGLWQSELVLRKSRAEIGSFLGLRLEPVSQTFSKFAQNGLIGAEKRNICMVRSDVLREIAGRAHRT